VGSGGLGTAPCTFSKKTMGLGNLLGQTSFRSIVKTASILSSLVIASVLLVGCGAPAEPAAGGTEPAKTETSMNGGMSMAASGTQAVFNVSGMDCISCATEVKDLISSQDGVKSCEVETSGVVTVVFDDSATSKEKLVETVNSKTSYKAAL
jgi:copper chaperone CopZ